MTEGIAYISIGQGGFNDELLMSIKSIRKNGGALADAPIRVYWGGSEPTIDVSNVEIVNAGVGEFCRGSRRMAHRIAKAKLYQNLPFDHTLFLDTDTLCAGDLNGILEGSDEYVRGVPDGRKPEARDMMVWAFGRRYKQFAMQVFGGEYLKAHNLPTAWNVGSMPLSRKMASKFSITFLRIIEFFAEDLEGQLFESYRHIFDEQIPLNYALWKNKVPTSDLHPKWNVTKTRMARFNVGEARIIHCRVKRDSIQLIKRFIDLNSLEAR